jgi:hypothetical protein
MLELPPSIGEHGTGARARGPGYTSPARPAPPASPTRDARGYSGEYIATFVGFAPVDDPRIVVAVMVDEPRPFYGGIVAAPVFSEVMQSALTARRVVPDAATAPSRRRCSRPARGRRARREPGGASHPGRRPRLAAVGTPAGGDGTAAIEPEG